jgi:hypothetical protein
VSGTKQVVSICHHCLDSDIEDLRLMGHKLRTAEKIHFYNNLRENLKEKNLLEVLDTEGSVISKLIPEKQSFE